jgi:ribosome-binding factor A
VPGNVKRTDRIAAMLVKELSWLLAREVRDPRAAFVAITGVKVTGDLRSARVFVRLVKDGELPDRRREALVGLSRAAGLLRSEVSRRLALRQAPELTFEYDDGQDDRMRIERLLEEVRMEERARSKA